MGFASTPSTTPHPRFAQQTASMVSNWRRRVGSLQGDWCVFVVIATMIMMMMMNINNKTRTTTTTTTAAATTTTSKQASNQPTNQRNNETTKQPNNQPNRQTDKQTDRQTNKQHHPHHHHHHHHHQKPLRSSKQNTAYLALDAPLPIAKCSARHVVKSIGLSTAEENLDLLQKNPGSPQQFQQNPYRFSISSGFPGFRTSTP
jgi:hypothetical protein